MRTYGMVVAALMALGGWGCAGDVAGSSGLLRAVDEQALTSQVLYMVPDVSALPLTQSQLGELQVDPSMATPVRVEVFDELAVAWFAPAGEAIISRSSIVALWEVVHRTPTAGRVANDPSPTDSYVVPSSTPVVTLDPGARATTNETVPSLVRVTSPAEQTIIEFFDRLGTPEEAAFVEIVSGYHPGCI